VGTPFYMAPEALKESIYSLKSDIFAIGALTYELLYSRPPWKADSEQKLYQHMVSVTPQYTSTRSPKINAFIQRCLAINPADRMDLEEMSDWLSKFSNLSR
jgi:serine/threonine protein kinase